jgi:hypothetical protein
MNNANKNGQINESLVENISNKVTHYVNKNILKNTYSVEPQISHKLGAIAKNKKRGKRKIDISILKNSLPFIFIETKSQTVPGTADEKIGTVLLEARSIVKDTNNSVNHFIFHKAVPENNWAFRFFNEQKKELPNCENVYWTRDSIELWNLLESLCE